MKHIGNLVFLLAIVSWGFIAPAAFADEDEWQGLPEGEGREEVFYACQACHSLMLVTQQGLDHYGWEETLDWMVDEQGMDELDPEEATLILGYLVKFYGRDRLAASLKNEN